MRFQIKDVSYNFLVPEFSVLEFSVWNFLSRKIVHWKFNSSEVILIKNHRDEAQNAPMNVFLWIQNGPLTDCHLLFPKEENVINAH